jgi:hypothetical protein
MPNGLECLMFYRLTEENYIQILVILDHVIRVHCLPSIPTPSTAREHHEDFMDTLDIM